MNKLSILFLAAALSAFPAHSASKFGPTDGFRDLGYSCYGCTTVTFTNVIPEMRAQGISPNLAMFSASETDQDFRTSTGVCKDTDYLALARVASYLATSPDVPRPFLLDLSGVIFGTNPERNCTTSSDVWYVRPDYQQRLATFKQVAGNNFNTSNVWSILIFGEVANQNGAVTDSTKINEIAAYVKQLWPHIPIMAGYPTAAALPGYGMQFFPSPQFPSNLDYIGTWDYSVGDPSGTQYAGAYPQLVNRLKIWQKLLYVVGTFARRQNGSCPALFDLNGERFDLLVRRWCAWAMEVHPDKALGLLNFYWGSPTSDTANGIINWELNNCGGTALRPAMVSAANAARTGSSCWTP
jgi:hypothetical protein